MGTMINFDKVPDTNPMGHVTPGFYKGTLKKTEVKTKDNGKDYLVITFDLADVNGKSMGMFSDFIRDTDSPVPLYKLGQLTRAFGIVLTGAVELKQLAKVLPLGKAVAMEIEDNTYNGKTSSQIKITNSQCYWPVSMLAGLAAAVAGAVGSVVEAEPVPTADINGNPFPFNAADGIAPSAVTPATEINGETGDNY